MKKLTFIIEVDDTEINGSFIDKLKDEVKDEKRQSTLTFKINTETTKQHRIVLTELANSLNQELGKVGLKFDEYRHDDNYNHYQKSLVKCVVNNRCVVLAITGQNDRNFKESKYTTYTGDYFLRIGGNNSPYYTANQCDKLTSKVKDVNDVLEYMKHSIKEHITNL